MTLNGKKKKFRKKDFVETMARFHVDNKAIENIFNKFKESLEGWHKFIDFSFLSDDMKTVYHDLIVKRANQIFEPAD